ncbi:LPXTG cell wall anchor domain-containing protein, partial [Arthrobacter mangrovi]|uniref:LPXTG cell wall anchor domain-containing protein n=1 Tax=Arthrobacter mangrovi TaxID=2966350 RepID=UPI00222EA7CA
FDGSDEFEEAGWSCEADFGAVEQDGDTVKPDHGQDVTCTATNELHAKHLEIEKSAGDAIDVGAGIWEIDYEVTVTNPSKFADREYDLTDTLEFGEGITATDAAWLLDYDDEDGVWSDPSGDPTATLAADREIEADSVHTYNVWVRVEVDEDADEDQLDCELNGDDGTGLLNRAVLNHKYEAEACAEVELPEEEYEHGEEEEEYEHGEEEEEETAPTPSPAPTPAPSPAPAPAPAPAPGAAAPQPAPVVRPQLAQTGTDSLWLVPGAGLLILGGAAATRLSRRKG